MENNSEAGFASAWFDVVGSGMVGIGMTWCGTVRYGFILFSVFE